MSQHDLIVIGAGPGGYVAAIRAAQLGMNVACIEKEPALGGTCLRVGCIPSKALLESSEIYAEAVGGLNEHGIDCGEVSLDLAKLMKRKDKVVQTLTGGVKSLFKKNKITRFQGHARLTGPNQVTVESQDGTEVLEGKKILIATGSVPATLPGIEFDGDRIGSSTEALKYPEVPEHLIVIGAGYIGLELGAVWRRLGAKVTVLEYLDRILPGMDSEIASEAKKLFKKQGLEFHLGTKVTGAKYDGEKCTVEIDGADPITCDRVLVAVGRRPNTKDLGLEDIGVELDDRGRIAVGDHFRTSVESIYAIGDVIQGPMLAHKAEEEGIACVEYLATGYGHINYDTIPGVVYTHPEIASVGKTEEQLKEAGVEYRKGSFPFIANGRARSIDETDGKIKVLADAKTDRILGVHIIGARAGDLIAEAAVAMEFGASSEDLARACHAHPTLAEALKEAALAVDGRAIHF
ncbi:dihydrolipoyl dehydrogenase [Thalassoroseus pseudoceratinae]|uniref:dihydrolipoyl dehydrogenase n=1 Tax=Thalassoroseus pseudoceratinae TaxID=2713176 RepID=UPI0014230C74|nr:dihydrolipoyl dehydrogenase [Thalassoroseus pseudoceratinae]